MLLGRVAQPMTRVVPSRSAVNSGLNFFMVGLNLEDVETCIATTLQPHTAFEPLKVASDADGALCHDFTKGANGGI